MTNIVVKILVILIWMMMGIYVSDVLLQLFIENITQYQHIIIMIIGAISMGIFAYSVLDKMEK